MPILLPSTKKLWAILGPEFDKDKGRKAVLVMVFYGLKFAGAALQSHLADCIIHLDYELMRLTPI